MRKLWYLSFIFVFLFSLFGVSAETFGTFSTTQDITLIQTCTTCSYVNISSITAPNSTVILSSTQMSKSGSKFEYTLPAQKTIGQYIVCGVGDLSGTPTDWCYIFHITKTGTNPSTAQGIIYFILLSISVFLFILCLYISASIDPSKYNKDSLTARFTSVNWNRYYRYGCWVIAYLMLVWMFNLCYEISLAFLESAFITEFFHVFYIILLSLAFPLFIYLLFMLIIGMLADKKANGYIQRGLQP